MSTAPKTREIQLACPSCSSRTLLCQSAQGDDWQPSETYVMNAQGWRKTSDGVYACSQTCVRIRNDDNPFQISGDEQFRRSAARGERPIYPRTFEEAAERRRERGEAPNAPIAASKPVDVPVQPLRAVLVIDDAAYQRRRASLEATASRTSALAALPDEGESR